MKEEKKPIPEPSNHALITRRTVLAIGLIQLRPGSSAPEQVFSNVQVLGYARMEEETKTISFCAEESDR